MEDAVLNMEKLGKKNKWMNIVILLIMVSFSIVMILGCIMQFMELSIASGVFYLFIAVCMLIAGLKVCQGDDSMDTFN